MSCAVCDDLLGITYSVINGITVHKACESSIKVCDTCNNRSKVNGKCSICISNREKIDNSPKYLCPKCCHDKYSCHKR